MDVDGGDLRLAGNARLGEATWATWRNPDVAIFTPGRLDLTLYPDALHYLSLRDVRPLIESRDASPVEAHATDAKPQITQGCALFTRRLGANVTVPAARSLAPL